VYNTCDSAEWLVVAVESGCVKELGYARSMMKRGIPRDECTGGICRNKPTSRDGLDMYVSHFGFHRQPFHSADAGRAFFVSESIRNILPQLLHALRSDLGIAVLTGVPGSGKTSLLRHIQQQISNEGRAIVCSGASLGTSTELFSVLLEASRKRAGTTELLEDFHLCLVTSGNAERDSGTDPPIRRTLGARAAVD
jgi:hypothetical protein